MNNEKKELIVRDWLAIERTKLANERTFLAYFRTTIVFLGTGIGITKMEIFSEIHDLGIISISVAPLILSVGIVRFYKVKQNIRKYYTVK